MSSATKFVLWLLGGAVRVAGFVDEQLLWSRLNIGGDIPEQRENTVAAVFADREQFYIYGGYAIIGEGTYLQDLWRFNLNGMTWEAIEAGGGDGPGRRQNYFCATFEALDRFYLFGGSSEGGPANDLWSFDVNSSNWTEVVAANDAPSPRKDGVTATFADKGVFFIYGGYGADNRQIDELWHFSLDTSMWSQVTFTVEDSGNLFPQGRQNHGVAVFADAGFFLVYAGRGAFGVYYDDLWRFEVDAGDSKTVVAKQAAVADVNMRPAPRYNMGIATFEAGRYFVMYGGYNGDLLGDTWRFDVDTDKWEELIVGDSAPPARFGHTVATFEADEVFYIFGGFSGVGHLDEMWMLGNGTTTTTTFSSTITITATETETNTDTTTITTATVTVTPAPSEAEFDWRTVALVVVLLIAFAIVGFFLGSRRQGVREASMPRQADASEVELMRGDAPVAREASVEV